LASITEDIFLTQRHNERNAGEPLSTPFPAPIGIVAGAFPESTDWQDEPRKSISSGKGLSLSLKPEGERFGFK
jgi:hypothetical protein